MRKVLAYTGAAALCLKLTSVKASAWCGVTHRDIIKKSLLLLDKEKKNKISAFFKDYTKTLEDGCTAPDSSGDIDHGAGMHYYSCCKPRGKELSQTNGYYKDRLGRFLPSARTLMEQNYASAVSLYKCGKKNEAMTCFARAAHFVSDMGCPVHVSNIRCMDRRGNIHNAFENHAKTTCTVYTAETFDRRLSKLYEKDTFQDALNKLVNYSAKFVKQVRSLDPLRFDDVESNTLIHTQQNVMALMVRFYNDCNTDSGNFIVENKNYSFKSFVSGLSITVSSKGLILAELDKDLEQKMKVIWNSDGSFCLKTADSSLVAKNLKGYIDPDSEHEPAKFRVISLGKRQFIITVGSKDFKRVLGCTPSGRLEITKFDPKRSSMIWTIN